MARVANKSAKQIKDEDFLKQLQKANAKTAEMKHVETVSEKTITENATPEISFEELKDMFGGGFTEAGYREMYKKFLSLSNNYPLRTEMHKEALITYIKYAFKRDEAIANDDMDAADKWGKLASKQATDAKINPNQLSAADLSDGISSFSKLVEAVEKTQDIIPILPKYKQAPHDMVDYTIWQYVNYIRRLQNLPEVKYAELYKFLDEKFEENKSSLPFLTKDKNGHYDDTEEAL